MICGKWKSASPYGLSLAGSRNHSVSCSLFFRCFLKMKMIRNPTASPIPTPIRSIHTSLIWEPLPEKSWMLSSRKAMMKHMKRLFRIFPRKRRVTRVERTKNSVTCASFLTRFPLIVLMPKRERSGLTMFSVIHPLSLADTAWGSRDCPQMNRSTRMARMKTIFRFTTVALNEKEPGQLECRKLFRSLLSWLLLQ